MTMMTGSLLQAPLLLLLLSCSCFTATAFLPPTTLRIKPLEAKRCGISDKVPPFGTTAATRFSFQLFGGLSSSSSEATTITDNVTLADVNNSNNNKMDPQVFSSGYSTRANLVEALREAVQMAVQGLPSASNNNPTIDLAIVSVSSLYDGGMEQPATVTVPSVLQAARDFYSGAEIQHLVGSSVAGCISSRCNTGSSSIQTSSSNGNAGIDVSTKSTAAVVTSTTPVELEGIPSVSVTLAFLPDVELRTFDCGKADVLDNIGRMAPNDWKRPLGLLGFAENDKGNVNAAAPAPVFLMLPSPAFSTGLDDLLFGISHYFPKCQVFGGIASTVSSLSRAKLFRYSVNMGGNAITLTDGCVGVAMNGDIQLQTLSAQGAKPVGGVYNILKGSESTIQAIVLDEQATKLLEMLEEEESKGDTEEDEEEDENLDARAKMARAYAKARIPKPPLAEANFLMRTLSDDDQAFMRRQLLIGLETSSQGGSAVPRTASELARLAEGRGHRFRVLTVASGGMKDGSVTFALGSVDINPGVRMRFFVRESSFARREVEALWLGYKKRQLNQQFLLDGSDVPPTTCVFMVPTLDRGSKFFLGKAGFESSAAARMIPSVPCISGFFANGVIGKVDVEPDSPIGLQGSASGYFLLSSKSGRPLYSAAAAAAEKAAAQERKALEQRTQLLMNAEDEKRRHRAEKGLSAASNRGGNDLDAKAPRSEDGELILKRREVHSGRALTVSTVEWSVAEKTATPTSVLEGFMWEKETEVDRFRERVPLANLVSQCRSAAADPTAPKPRDFMGPVRQAMADAQGFVIIPECKRMEPSIGSLRRRYDVGKLVKSFTSDAKAPAISVNCDGVLFGGSLEDITTARQAASAASVETISDDGVIVPPILASDLLLYPYQLYKLRLAGADAVTMVVGALPKKDLTYLIKIASSLQLQTLVSVHTQVQLASVADIPKGSISGIIVSNRELEDFSFDMSGEQALGLLRSEAMAKVREVHGDDILVLVEGRVGLIERPDENGQSSALAYLRELKAAGASGCIIGGGLVKDSKDSSRVVPELQKQIANE